MKYFFRLLALPFFVLASSVGYLRYTYLIMTNFVRYGGETITHIKGDQASIGKIYQEMVAQRETLERMQAANKVYSKPLTTHESFREDKFNGQN